MVCLVDLPWVGKALGEARRFILSRKAGSAPGKVKENLRWQPVTAKGPAGPAPAAPKAATPKAAPTPKQPTAKAAATGKPNRNLNQFKADIKRQPREAIEGLLKFKTQLGPDRVKAVESELKRRSTQAPAPRPSEMKRQAGVSGNRSAPRVRELKEVDDLAKLGPMALNMGLGALPGRGEPGGDNPDVVIARLRMRAARNKLRGALQDVGPIGNKDYFNSKDDYVLENMLAIGNLKPRQRLRLEKEVRRRLAGTVAPRGLDVNKPIRVDKKLLAQNESVLQEVLRQRDRSLNPKQRQAIEGELQKRGAQVKPKNKNNSFKDASQDYDFASAKKAPGIEFGDGAFGKVRLLDRGEVVKDGKIGQYEAAILEKLQGQGIAPRLMGVQYARAKQPKTVGPGYGGHVREREGQLAMERAPGDKWGKQLYSATKAEKEKMMDAYLGIRAKLHQQGIAHNDMHGGNVFYDPKTGKAMLIDMGLAQMGYKPALIEALAAFNGKDFQADKYPLGQAPVANKLKQNIAKVIKEIETKYGIREYDIPNIRSPMSRIEARLGKISEVEAKRLVGEVYKGVGSTTPTAKAPTPKATTPKAPTPKAPAPKASTPKAPTPKAPTPKAPTAKPNGVMDEFKSAIKKQKPGALEVMLRYRDQIGSERAKAIESELQRRKNQAPTKAPSAKQSAPKDSFLQPKKPGEYDFSAEARKPGWIKIGKDLQGAQAEDVRLNRNISQPAALKNGKIGQYEAAALEKLRNVSNVPNLYGVSYDSKGSARTVAPEIGGSLGPHIKERPGKLAMELKEGTPVFKYLAKPGARRPTENDRRNDVIGEELIKARKAIHMRGVAHNDMHAGNVLYNESKNRLNVIDFGLAQVSPKAALIEALGGNNGKDWQGTDLLFLAGGPKVRKYYDNVKAVEKKLEAQGLDLARVPGIRTPIEKINSYLGPMTDSQAQKLVAEIYDGI
jgi:tRNA A-37 threonylcarbamoyl transferase component Bud32